MKSFFKNKKILVTGGAGFVGSHLCEKLVALGSDVSVLDNFSTGKKENLKSISNAIKVFLGYVEDYESCKKSAAGADYVFHLAYPYGSQGRGLEQQYIDDGVVGTFNVLKAAVESGVKKVVNVSSVAAYGTLEKTVLKETDSGETFLPYGVTKLSGELYCKAFSKMYGLDTISLRYFYVYGERYATFDHSALVKFMECGVKNIPMEIYGTGEQVRDYTYISDVINGTCLSLMSEYSDGNVYNIGKGCGHSIIDLATMVSKMTSNGEIIFKDGTERYADQYCKIPTGLTRKVNGTWIDDRSYVADINRAKEDFGYDPEIVLGEGIKRTIEWMLKNE